MTKLNLPVLPLRDIVVFPHMVAPLFVGRKQSVNALNNVMVADKKILLLSQKNSEIDNPIEKNLYTYGTIAKVLQLLKLPDGTLKVLVEPSYSGPQSYLFQAHSLAEAVLQSALFPCQV